MLNVSQAEPSHLNIFSTLKNAPSGSLLVPGRNRCSPVLQSDLHNLLCYGCNLISHTRLFGDVFQIALDEEYKQITNEPSSSDSGAVSSSEVTTLKQRVVSVERSVENVLTKVENVLTKLESNEQAQGKRRKTLTKLLNPLIQVLFRL